MKKTSKCSTSILSLILSSTLTLALVPAAFATPSYSQETNALDVSSTTAQCDDVVPDQDGLVENSWRYEDGLPLSEGALEGASQNGANDINEANDGISLLAYEHAWEWYGGGFRNSLGGIIEGATTKGIDVSEHQGWINWQTVKDSGIGFAIIRCGYGSDYTTQDDRYWKYNVSECERLGIPYGVYIYSYAQTAAMADSEANHVLRLLRGHRPAYPIYYDMEDKSMPQDPATLGRLANVFCNKIQNAGYSVGTYANLHWYNELLTDPVFNNWERWVAQYNYRCDYKGPYRIWQSTSSGHVPGIDGRVDVNFEFGYRGNVAQPYGHSDVWPGEWYVTNGAYDYVTNNNLMNGYAGMNKFGPFDPITRGTMVMILHNMAGNPYISARAFNDVDYSLYYGNAINWARARGIVEGISGTNNFDPEGLLTREQLAAMLTRYANIVHSMSTWTNGAALYSKPDWRLVSPWAWNCMAWCVDRGIIKGDSNTGYINPQGQALRSEVATMVTRFHRDVI